jgi:ornithine cyclodeaminase/alanine dehydrogenase-like protein (mu-crystallin family)
VAVPFFSAGDVEAAVPPERAYDAVHAGFIAHARGEWTMQPKLYVTNYPAGDFRAMPALGDGHALLKWVTSFPGNPARGLPTVSGLVVLSDAETGLVEAQPEGTGPRREALGRRPGAAPVGRRRARRRRFLERG